MEKEVERGPGITGPVMKSLNLPGDTPVRYGDTEPLSQRYERETGEKVTPAMEAYREWAMKGGGL